MAHDIDTNDGSIHFGGGLTLFHNMTLRQFLAADVVVRHDIDMKTGWRLVSSGPQLLFDRSAFFSLNLFHEELKRVTLALIEPGLTTPEDLRRIHDSVLTAEFGAAHVRNVQGLYYIFPWGNLASIYDPRGDQSSIVLNWK
jgi:hypothetical protein